MKTTSQIASEMAITPARVHQIRKQLGVGTWTGTIWLYSGKDQEAMRKWRREFGRTRKGK